MVVLEMVNSFYHPTTHGVGVRTGKAYLLKMSDGREENEPAIKLPIVQVFKSAEMVAEFICGNDIDSSITMLENYMPTLKEAGAPPGSIETIYSEEQLESSIASNKKTIVKIFREGCKKCVILDPKFENWATDESMGGDSVAWLQANVDYIPDYVSVSIYFLLLYPFDHTLRTGLSPLPCLEIVSFRSPRMTLFIPLDSERASYEIVSYHSLSTTLFTPLDRERASHWGCRLKRRFVIDLDLTYTKFKPELISSIA